MNVYACCYRGNLGYGCRIRGRRWMFVPDFGQPDRRIHRDVAIADLTFANPWAQQFEIDRERPFALNGFANWLTDSAGEQKARSVGGLLCTNA